MSIQTDKQLQQFLRNKALESLYFFCKVVMGFRDMTPDLHRDVCSFLQGHNHFKLLELPRGHLKTSIGTIAYPLWRVCRNPEIRILIANATATNATHFLRAIANTIEGSAMFRWLFPEVIPDFKKVKWTSTEIEVRRQGKYPEATIECIGVGGTVVSRHYDLIVKDDLVNEDHILSTDQMEKVVEWHKYSASLVVDPVSFEELVVGTRWAFNDAISYIKDNQPYYKIYSRSVLEDEKPIWPERFPQDVITRILELQGPRIFSCQYMNNPVHDSSQSFDPAWIREFDTLPNRAIKFYTAIDPALSEKRGDYSGIVTVGRDSDYNLYIVDARHGRWGVDEFIDNIFEVYNSYRPVVIGLESVLFQKALLWPIREAMRRHRQYLPMRELRPNTQVVKEVRIASLHEPLATGALWLRRGLKDLKKELKEFPLGAHDDLLDAAAYAVQMAKPASDVVKVHENPLALDAVLKSLKQKSRRVLWAWHKGPQYA